jgi:uncharacterized membrane protein YoaT (DUF817 family)
MWHTAFLYPFHETFMMIGIIVYLFNSMSFAIGLWLYDNKENIMHIKGKFPPPENSDTEI